MKRNYSKMTAMIFIVCFSFVAKAQIDDVTQVLKGGIADANTLLKAYLQPLGEGTSLGLSNGWYNTAKPHKILGFDITFTGGVASVPTDKQIFDVSKLSLTTLSAGARPIGPTFLGKKGDGAQVVLSKTVEKPGGGTETASQTIDMPGGTGLTKAPLLMVQAGVGLPFGTELMIRYCPTINIGDLGKLGLWGIGIKHDIKQWIPVISSVPFWSMSGMVGYTSQKISSKEGRYLAPDPNQYYTDNVDMTIYDGQSVEFSANAFTANLLVSTDIPIFNVYGGVGIVKPTANIKLKGVYPLPGTPTPQQVASSYPTVKFGVENSNADPVNAEFDDLKTKFRANIGARLKFFLFTFHGDIAVCGGYTLYSGGFGINFR